MQLGMIGLGRMGANMVRRLMRDGHECVVWDPSADAVAELAAGGAVAAASAAGLGANLAAPRAVWLEADVGALAEAGILRGGDVMRHLEGWPQAVLLAGALGHEPEALTAMTPDSNGQPAVA